MTLVPTSYDVPTGLETDRFRLRPLRTSDALPHYDALFQNWTDNGWNYHIAQYSAGWAGQPNLRGFEFRDVDGWIVGDGVKYLWFDT